MRINYLISLKLIAPPRIEKDNENIRSLMDSQGDNFRSSLSVVDKFGGTRQEVSLSQSPQESLKIFIQAEDYFSSSSKQKYLIFFPERKSEFVYCKINKLKKEKKIVQTEQGDSDKKNQEVQEEGLLKISKIKNKGWLNPANHVALITPKGDIYLIGGVDPNSSKTLPSLHRFNKKESSMELMVPMEQPRHSFSALYCNRYIYALGGSPGDDALALRSCERFNTRGKNWEKISDMSVASIGATSCVYEEKFILKIGGKRDKFTHNTEIERYTIENDRWDLLRLRFLDKSKNLMPEKLPFRAGAFQVKF